MQPSHCTRLRFGFRAYDGADLAKAGGATGKATAEELRQLFASAGREGQARVIAEKLAGAARSRPSTKRWLACFAQVSAASVWGASAIVHSVW
ncbi:MAG TPA: hypothetical protein VEK34_11055 [Methylocella sp.]|nr:hypothetical protein [Methylocella sp.]